MTVAVPRFPIPPFSYDEAVLKVRMAENAWNGRDPAKVALAYTPDNKWRNRSEFLSGRAEVEAFLTRKWSVESGYRLIKEIWTHSDTRIAVRFCYEYHDDAGQWYRAHGNENWAFDADGYMAERHASIKDVLIADSERLFHWPTPGSRPDGHPGLTELGLLLFKLSHLEINK
jgi:nuclear transport factor 2 (NTF2) superfamily protein